MMRISERLVLQQTSDDPYEFVLLDESTQKEIVLNEKEGRAFVHAFADSINAWVEDL